MKRHKKESGFTLIELMIYTALTAIIVGMFGAILVTVTRIQGQQSGSIQVTREINFLMSAISSRIRDSHQIVSASSSELKLFTFSHPEQTTIKLNGDAIELEEGGAAFEALSSDRIIVDTLEFVQRSDTTNTSSTVIFITITARNVAAIPQDEVTRTVKTSVSPLLQSL